MSPRPWLLLAATVGAWSCGGDEAPERDAPRGEGEQHADAPTPLRTATDPGPCEWVTVAEIERIIGPLEGPPNREGTGCRYFRPIDSLTPEWAKARELERKLRALGADPDGFKRLELRRPALLVDVDVRGDIAGERGVAAAGKVLSSWLPADKRVADSSQRPDSSLTPAGWDVASAPLGFGGFTGRVGHVRVTIALDKLRVPRDTVIALANRVRDRVPDLPHAHPAADMARAPLPGPAPCSLLTRAEAEARLGKLLVPPFRTHDGTALADPAGPSCGYYTPGHHVLVLTPEWEYGKSAMDATRMVGGLMSRVADFSDIVADTLEGPWDDAAVDPGGELHFLKGHRLLTVGYLTSSTDARGAISLAGVALKRLADTRSPADARPAKSDAGCPLSTAQVGEIMATPVRLSMNMTSICQFELVDDPGLFVDLSAKPAESAERVFEQLRSSAKAMLGQSAEADRLRLGEGGWAFGSNSKSEAAAVARGKLYHAEMEYMMRTSVGNKKDAMVSLVAKMIH
jgi:hypothetical protein